MATWNTAYEALPPGTGETPSSGDNRLVSLKEEIGDRFGQEHEWMNTSSTGMTAHKEGSTRVYYQATAPTNRPDTITTTALNTEDDGRLFVDSDVKELQVWDGDSFAAFGGNSLIDQGGGTHLKVKVFPLTNFPQGTYYYIATSPTFSTIRYTKVLVHPDDSSVMRSLTTFNGNSWWDVRSSGGMRIYMGSNTGEWYLTAGNRGYAMVFYVEV